MRELEKRGNGEKVKGRLCEGETGQKKRKCDFATLRIGVYFENMGKLI